MATKWNSKNELMKGITAFVAFVLGVTLTLSSVLGAGKLLTSQDAEMEWWRSDWQETTAFKYEVSNYLRQFLSIGFDDDADFLWYDMNNRIEKEHLLPGSVEHTHVWDVAVPSPMAETVYASNAPDAEYKEDQNVIYGIAIGTPDDWFTNLPATYEWESLPDTYTFLLSYRDGKVSITKDGNEIDIYGDGVYDSAEEWYLPGYTNFKTGDVAEDVTVRIAVRQIPVQEYGEGRYSSSRMYQLHETYNDARSTAIQLAVTFGIGVVLLLLAHILRKERSKVNECVAIVTAHIWTEAKVLLLILLLIVHVFLTGGGAQYWLGDILERVFVQDQYLAALTGLLLAFWPTTPLLCLVWLCWLNHNDHRHNKDAVRKGLLQKLRARDLKRPVQKRLQRSIIGSLFANGLVLLLSVLALIYLLSELSYGWYDWYEWPFLFFILVIALDLFILFLMYSSWKSLRAAKDIGLLAEQITAIHDGNLSTSIDLPKDADLHQAAVQLNDIQAGLEKALQDRTQSERMKVELISNVSHDLKTPLTSVLSYAALLEEEDLSGAAGDYARIILEKAKRLDVMVQDVFSISKAASGQLKLTPERLDLSKLLRQTLADMNDAIEKSGLTLKTDLPTEPIEIIADGERLYRVFQNLLQNALQYSIPSSRVYLSLTASTDTACVMVRNTSATELPTGMDFTARFTRGDESRTDGGAGLGLSIASSFTEACGGKLSVETVADLFTVTVTFPLA